MLRYIVELWSFGPELEIWYLRSAVHRRANINLLKPRKCSITAASAAVRTVGSFAPKVLHTLTAAS